MIASEVRVLDRSFEQLAGRAVRPRLAEDLQSGSSNKSPARPSSIFWYWKRISEKTSIRASWQAKTMPFAL
ncbi:hypothetical protein GS592_26000 [Rhodococcus hoagii]|nr:hypothetical protein [Prescottella equi]